MILTILYNLDKAQIEAGSIQVHTPNDNDGGIEGSQGHQRAACGRSNNVRPNKGKYISRPSNIVYTISQGFRKR
jgi:hypothetical protein